MVYENINLHQREKAYIYASYAWCLWSLKICHILLLDSVLKWNVRSYFKNTMVYRSTVCPIKWAAVVLVLVESSMHFFPLKDLMRWFTPSWSCFLVMFSCQKSHVVSVAVFIFVIIRCLLLLVWFKLYFGIYSIKLIC